MIDPITDMEPTDAERFPSLNEHGRAMLNFLREHPHAPRYRNESGNRLRPEDLPAVRESEREAMSAAIAWQPGVPPPWVPAFIARCLADVPAYREYGDFGAASRLVDLPTTDRGDFAHDIARHVPDSVDVSRLINYRTSGTTGHPLLIASDPRVAAQYLGYHKRALARAGITLTHGRGQVGVVLLGHQTKCFTYVSVTPTMDDSGLAKINLHPADWRHPDDRARYLEALAAEVVAGDPISFAELLKLDANLRPRALLCTSMALLPGLRAELESRFGCPVLDLYSLNEVGPVAVSIDGGDHVLLQHRLYVEILDEADKPVAPGMPGEITLTGGFNFCLPLLRYRTGDRAALERRGADLVLVGLSGRPAVRFRAANGEWLNNIEITHALRGLPIAQFTLHQHAGGELTFEYQGQADAARIRAALLGCFGAAQRLDLRAVEFDGKRVQYTTALVV